MTLLNTDMRDPCWGYSCVPNFQLVWSKKGYTPTEIKERKIITDQISKVTYKEIGIGYLNNSAQKRIIHYAQAIALSVLAIFIVPLFIRLYRDEVRRLFKLGNQKTYPVYLFVEESSMTTKFVQQTDTDNEKETNNEKKPKKPKKSEASE